MRRSKCILLIRFYGIFGMLLEMAESNQFSFDNLPVCRSSCSDYYYRSEADRLSTFKNWPNSNITPESLAKAGFYYLNDSDKVKCAWCSGVVAEWEAGDNAIEEHKRLFPKCPLVVQGQNNPTPDYNAKGVHEFKSPKKPVYACLNVRLRTFENWPRSDIQKPEVLAKAGFYYQNADDQVRCFHCNGGLRSWRKEDVPWVEHAKWFPHCQYVLLAKGQAFIDKILAQHTPEYSREQLGMMPMSLEDAMSTRPVITALQIGLNPSRIKDTVKRRLESVGKPYNTIEELIDAVWDDIGNVENCVEGTVANSPTKTTTTSEEPTFLNNMLKRNITHDENTAGIATECGGNSENSHNTNPNNEAAIELMTQKSLEEENRRLKDARMCKICMDEECEVVFLPCSHLVTCSLCAPTIKECPICRRRIEAFVRTFLS